MDFNYNENQKLIAEMIRSFSAKEIYPNIKLWDDNQIFPVNVFKKLGKLVQWSLGSTIWRTRFWIQISLQLKIIKLCLHKINNGGS